jgi:hypothetical protein
MQASDRPALGCDMLCSGMATCSWWASSWRGQSSTWPPWVERLWLPALPWCATVHCVTIQHDELLEEAMRPCWLPPTA